MQLAQKGYEEKLLKILDQEIGAIDSYFEKSPALGPEGLYDSLSEKRKALVLPAIETDAMIRKRFEDLVYEKKGFDKDAPEFYTEKGERVRSKSEVIIANRLLKEDIPYHYEYPVLLKGFGLVHPDFMILNVRRRKVFYWEHRGMMDKEGYANDAISKTRAYQLNGIFLGDKLIITEETENLPMNIREINSVIQYYFI